MFSRHSPRNILGINPTDTIKDGGGIISLIKGDGLTPFSGEVSFEDQGDAEKPFAPHYEEHIRPHVQIFEEKRIDALTSSRKRLFNTGPIGLLTLIAATYYFLSYSTILSRIEIIGTLVVIVLGIISFYTYNPVRKYKSRVKEIIFPKIFSFFGDDYKYSKNGLLSMESLEPSKIIPHYDGKKLEDYVKGSHKDVTLELCEALLTQTTGSGEDQRTDTVFKGMFILLGMNKDFSGKTIIKRDAGKIGNWLTKGFQDLENVKLEDPVFEKEFEVYSSDQIEARYLLTTSFMERLLQLCNLFGGKGIQASFFNDKLLLMIPSDKNYFEVSSAFKPATFVEDINLILEEMDLIFQIIDTLKLDQKTGL